MDDSSSTSSAGTVVYSCPHCGQEVEASAGQETAHMVACPHCNVQFIVAAEDGSTELPEEREEEQRKAEREDELSAMRIHQLSRSRRATIRARSYCLVGTMAGIVIGIQLIWQGIHDYRGNHRMIPLAAYLLASVVLFMLALHFYGQASHYADELVIQSSPEPTTPPDFSTLSDGSQAAKNLENLDER